MPTPTHEQQAAMDLFSTGADLVIEAGAGTGKTTTLGMLARSAGLRVGHYLAFNRAIARDAGKAMPMTVRATTVHAAAAQQLRQQPGHRPLLDRLNGGRVNSSKIAKHLGLGPLIVTVPTGGTPRTKVLQPAWQAGHIIRAIRTFCQSDDAEPGPQHFGHVHGIDAPDRPDHNNAQVAKELEAGLARAWADLQVPNGLLRFEHDHYLKMWALGPARLGAEYVMLDEAQDASPVMLGVLRRQGCQVVYVGDSHQQIYEWRGAVNALGLVDAPRTFLTQSWRFGHEVANIANLTLDLLGADIRLRGTDSVASVVWTEGPRPRADAVLCRSNAHAINVVIQYQARGLAPHLVGGAEDILYFAQAAGRLQAGERTGHPELACFESWREVVAYVADDPQGSELAMLVGLLEDYGIDIVCDALDGTVAEAGADVVVSTAHRAKGREWPAVRLGADYPDLNPDEPLVPEELRLLYVAATRARLGLDISGCQPLLELVGAL
jgi:hypothetical protein